MAAERILAGVLAFILRCAAVPPYLHPQRFFAKQDRSGRLLETVAAKAKTVSSSPSRFINRELSWLEFNQRVLDEALDSQNPLLERVKFFCIVSSNLDEFFEVRVAGLKQQIESDIVERSLDGLTASEAFRAINRRVRDMVNNLYACWRDQLMPALSKSGIRILEMAD